MLFAVYLLTARAGLKMDAVSNFATLVWPPTGIALAALVLGGCRLWTAVALAAFAANVWQGAPWPVALGIGLGNAAEAVVGAFLLRQASFRGDLRRPHDVLCLVTLASVLSTTVSASIGVAVLHLGGVIPQATAQATWRAWWIGDALSALIVAPLVLVWAAQLRQRLTLRFYSRQTLEGAVFIVSLGIVAAIVFGQKPQPTSITLAQPYLFFPMVIWAATRFGVCCTVTVNFLVVAIAIAATAFGYGPFAGSSLAGGLTLLHIFTAAVSGTGLTLSAAIAERILGDAERTQRTERVAAEERIRSILHHAYDAFVAMDAAGIITEWNRQAELIFGWTRHEVLGCKLAHVLVPQRLRAAHQAGLEHFLATGEGAAINTRTLLPALHRLGHEVAVELTISPVKAGESYFFGAFLRDVTEEQRAEQLQRVLLAVTRLLTGSGEIEAVLHQALITTCAGLGWDFAAVWQPNTEQTHLRCTQLWYPEEERLAAFAQETRRHNFAKGKGLPGRVWASGEAAWIEDVVQDRNFPRAPAAHAASLHSAVGFPVFAGAALIGIIEFFSHQVCRVEKMCWR